MNNFNFYSPTHYYFGKGKEEETGAAVKLAGGSKVLIHYGGGSVIRSGLMDRVKKSLDAAGISYCELGGVEPNPKASLVRKGIELARKENVDLILAVGGGSTIDSSKGIAMGVPYDGDFWDFYGMRDIEEALPIGVVLTIAAAGTEACDDSIITDDVTLLKRCATSDLIKPKFAIMNPELLSTLPEAQIRYAMTDIVSHCMERYFTRTPDVDLTDRILEGIMLATMKAGKKLLEDPNDYGALCNFMWASTAAHGNNFMAVGREQDWGAHRVADGVDSLYDVPHAVSLSVIIPHWMERALKVDVNRFAQFAVRIFGVPMDFHNPELTAREGIAAYKAWLKSIDMPTTRTAIGGKAEDIPKLAEMMFDRRPIGGKFLKLTEETIDEVIAIYELSLASD